MKKRWKLADLGDLEASLKAHKATLEIERAIGHSNGVANQLGNIGLVYRDKGDLGAALKAFEQALAIHRAIGHPQGIVNALANIDLIYRALGDHEEGAGAIHPTSTA